MIAKLKDRFTKVWNWVWNNREKIYTCLVFFGVILTIIAMYFRAFLGTEITDEAYYISEAKEMLNGNIPFAYNNASKAVGFTFLLVPLEALYRLFVPDFIGLVLFTRLCFVTYKVMICAVVYSVFQRKLKKSSAMLLSALLLPLNGIVPNFSYNTVPELTFFMVGCILYDVLEQDAPHNKARLLFAGFMTGIACFANPGWGFALVIFAALIAIRMKGKANKIKSLLYYGCAVLSVVIIVVLAISIRTSFSEFWYGFYRLFINPIPMDPLNPNKSWAKVFRSFKDPVLKWILIFAPASVLTYFISSRYLNRRGEKLSKNQSVLLSITVAMFIYQMYMIFTTVPYIAFSGGGEERAFGTFCYMIVYIVAGAYKKDKIVWYLGIYQAIYAISALVLLSHDASIWRFLNVYSVIVPVLYILIKNQSKSIRIMSVILSVAVILSLGYANFKRLYRDYVHVFSLNNQVHTGVYKGLYTNEYRVNHLPQMEEYLNSLIDEDETYAFKDNAPFAYLMMHKGKVCELTTWDILQHQYGRNSPAVLFDYYRKRDMIPDKIIYIDYNYNRNLSIEDHDYRYNDWINAYYDPVEDKKINDTFFRVVVYKYNGTFDGDYQWWIDSYWDLVK